jgi:hypothetical protein
MSLDHLQRLFHSTVSNISVKCTHCATEPCLFAKNANIHRCQPPKCAACELAKAKRRNPTVSTSQRTRSDVLKTDHVLPGQKVSVDQYESSVRRRIPTSRGRDSFGQKFGGGTIFCDRALGFVACHHQVSLRASDTIGSKRKFERDIRTCGIQVEAYHGDNGIFKAKEFR